MNENEINWEKRSAILKHVAVETNSENTSGVCTALYFDSVANREDIVESLRYIHDHREEFPNVPLVTLVDEYLDYEERPTPLSREAGWCRFEVYGSC